MIDQNGPDCFCIERFERCGSSVKIDDVQLVLCYVNEAKVSRRRLIERGFAQPAVQFEIGLQKGFSWTVSISTKWSWRSLLSSETGEEL